MHLLRTLLLIAKKLLQSYDCSHNPHHETMATKGESGVHYGQIHS